MRLKWIQCGQRASVTVSIQCYNIKLLSVLPQLFWRCFNLNVLSLFFFIIFLQPRYILPSPPSQVVFQVVSQVVKNEGKSA